MNEPHADFKIDFSDPRTQDYLVKYLRFPANRPMGVFKKDFYLKTQLFVIALAQEMERIEPLAFRSEGKCAHFLKRRYKYKYRKLEKMRDACIEMVEAMLNTDKKYSLEEKSAAIKKFYHRTQNWWVKTALKILAIGAISAACAFLGFIVGAALSFGFAGIPGAILGLKVGLNAIMAMTLTEAVGAGMGGSVALIASSIGFFHKDERQVKAGYAIDAAEKWLNRPHHP